MKLDKIKFAQLINYIAAGIGHELSREAIVELDELIDIDVPQADSYCAPTNVDIEHLMRLMVAGTYKIEAIKYHRKLTGMGLKDSKDIVERYWKEPVQSNKDMLEDMLNIVDSTMRGNSTILANLPAAELSEVKRFINTYVK